MDKQMLKTSFSLLFKYLICITMSVIVTVSLFMIFAAISESGDDVTGVRYAVMLVLSAFCSLSTLVLFINGKVFYIGDSDANKVQFGRIEFDKFKGLKLGVVPAVFALISYIVLILGKLGIVGAWASVLFNFTNYHLFAYHQLIFGGNNNIADMSWPSIAAASLTIFLVPLICHVCYTLGYKRINLFEKVVFKKKGDK